ncbi:hypothetical protein T07_4200 [Trichinella nelsoni]|uniref:Uncharacterized protein n=1 Tax=Trichinella nelsoni TaxID=6336 RepID=A0A0V0RQM1_9BILA|nr:hypothetical protein T07_4200 [Trichinella nelsoni]
MTVPPSVYKTRNNQYQSFLLSVNLHDKRSNKLGIIGCEAQLLSGQDCDLKYQPMAVFFPVFTIVTALATSISNVQAVQCVDCQPPN